MNGYKILAISLLLSMASLACGGEESYIDLDDSAKAERIIGTGECCKARDRQGYNIVLTTSAEECDTLIEEYEMHHTPGKYPYIVPSWDTECLYMESSPRGKCMIRNSQSDDLSDEWVPSNFPIPACKWLNLLTYRGDSFFRSIFNYSGDYWWNFHHED